MCRSSFEFIHWITDGGHVRTWSLSEGALCAVTFRDLNQFGDVEHCFNGVSCWLEVFKLFTAPSFSSLTAYMNSYITLTVLGSVFVCYCAGWRAGTWSLRGFDVRVCHTRLCRLCFYFLSVMCLTLSSLLLLASVKEEVGETTSCFFRVWFFCWFTAALRSSGHHRSSQNTHTPKSISRSVSESFLIQQPKGTINQPMRWGHFTSDWSHVWKSSKCLFAGVESRKKIDVSEIKWGSWFSCLELRWRFSV